MTQPRTGWRTPVVVALTAIVTVIAADFALQRLSPLPPPVLEVDDGVDALAENNPETLVLGSSHTRSFQPIAERLGPGRMVLVAEEGGTFSAFNWVLQQRLRPLLDTQKPDGTPVKDKLRRAVLVTTYWDMCPGSYTGFAGNLPARAWRWPHYARDVWANGLTAINRNFLQTRWKQLLPWSALVQDRGLSLIPAALKQAARPETEEARYQRRIDQRYREIEEEGEICDDPREKAALNETLDYLIGRGLDVTVLLFPLMPETLSEKSKQTTLPRYAGYLQELARQKPFRVVDMSTNTPLAKEDYEEDCDHVRPHGNRKFADWALSHELAFLLEPAG